MLSEKNCPKKIAVIRYFPRSIKSFHASSYCFLFMGCMGRFTLFFVVVNHNCYDGEDACAAEKIAIEEFHNV